MSQPDAFAPPSGTPSGSGTADAPPSVVASFGVAPSTRPPFAPWSLPSVPRGLATATIVLAVVITAWRVVLAILAFPATTVWSEAARLDMSLQETPLVAYDLVGMLGVPLDVAVFVVGCLWLARSRSFAVAVNPGARHARKPVWVWLGWFVPLVSAWFPYQVVRDIGAATGPRRPGQGPVQNPLPLLGVWWASWLLSLFCDRVTQRMTGGVLGTGEVSDAVESFAAIESLAALATVVGCVLWVVYVRKITAAQVEHVEQLRSA